MWINNTNSDSIKLKSTADFKTRMSNFVSIPKIIALSVNTVES